MTQALDGLTVVDVSGGIAGPMTTMLMSDYGAEVIKVEPPGGDPFRTAPGYLAWNRGKKSVVLDLKSDADGAKFDEIVRRADILLESFAPGTTARLGIAYDRLHELNPRLIYCSITGYGRQGAVSQRPAYDALVQARTGMQFEQPGWRPGPIFLHLPLPSLGAFFLASCAINAALHAREVTGRGQWVETSLMQGVLAWTTMLWNRIEHQPPGFMGPFEHRDFAPTPCYADQDGEWFHPMPDGVPVALEALGLPPETIKGSPMGTYEEVQAYFASVQDLYKRWPRDKWVPLMWEHGVSCQPVLSAEEAFSNPQILSNGVVDEVDIPGVGKVKQFSHPYNMELCESKIQGPPPAVGEHTESVLAGLQARPVVSASPPARAQALKRPLEGIRVLDLGLALAGPYGPMILADLGADVIKIENARPRGGALPAGSGNFLWFACQRGKRCIALDLKSEEGKKILYDLIKTADILHYNMRMGVADRLGFDYETVKRINPRIIYCHSTAYGQTGPYAKFPGVDQMAQALCGIEYEQGATPAGGEPTWYRFGHCDASNGFLAAIAMMQALYHRDRTGEGQFLDTCIVDAGTLVASDAVLLPSNTLSPRPQLDKNQTGYGPLYRLYETQAGWICIVCPGDVEWARLCGVLGLADTATDARFASAAAREEHAAELVAILEPAFRTLDAAEWFRLLDEQGVPCEIAAEDFAETWYDDPDVIANAWVVKYQHPSFGTTEQYGRLFSFSEMPEQNLAPPPEIGQHTREILTDLGYDDAGIAALHKAAVVQIAPEPQRGTEAVST